MRPASRVGEVLEAVPGLIVTQHSGEGKANQYFLRGFNLDHGTDLAITVDGMPVNMRTHGHGQGYADLNFLIPELCSRSMSARARISPTKATSPPPARSTSTSSNRLPKGIAELTVGSFGYRRALAAGSTTVGDGNAARRLRGQHVQRPVGRAGRHPQAQRRAALQPGQRDNGFSLTAMAYRNGWNSTDQVAQRAIDRG